MTAPESLTLSASDASTPARPATLDLLLPADLPTRVAPSAAEAALSAAILRDFLALLDAPAGRAARCRVLLARLGDGRATVAGVGVTLIPAKTAEVEDFDRYFNVRRIATDTPGLALLRGLLQGAAGVFALAENAALPPAQVTRQVAGFAAYAGLLGRMSGLDLQQ